MALVYLAIEAKLHFGPDGPATAEQYEATMARVMEALSEIVGDGLGADVDLELIESAGEVEGGELRTEFSRS
ncbi:MAG: hypothetical protein K0S42_127 [Microvirga sp.]|jgi:hypothetical protein|nr:hypothetical protein [Microvirga sp.]